MFGIVTTRLSKHTRQEIEWKQKIIYLVPHARRAHYHLPHNQRLRGPRDIALHGFSPRTSFIVIRGVLSTQLTQPPDPGSLNISIFNINTSMTVFCIIYFLNGDGDVPGGHGKIAQNIFCVSRVCCFFFLGLSY